MNNNFRWKYVCIGVIILLIAGMVYAWSVLSVPISKEFPHWSKAQLSLTFTIVMIMFCAGSMIGGYLSKTITPKVEIQVSAILFVLGFYFAQKATSPEMLYFGFGVLCGLASGLSYTAVLGTVNRWFPDKQGLISGILLMGFGLSSFIVGKLFQAYTPQVCGGWRKSFLFVGIIAAIVLLGCSFCIKQPNKDAYMAISNSKQKSYFNSKDEVDTRGMIKRKEFWIYYLWAIFLSASGLALVSHASGIATESTTKVNESTIATVVGLISIFNAVGRVAFGYLYDKCGRTVTMQTVNLLFAITSIILFFAIKKQNFDIVTIGFIIGGFSYGGVTPTNSSFVSTHYGLKHYPMNLSVINTNLLIASFGSTIVGLLYDKSQSYLSTFVFVFVLATMGVILAILISFCEKKKLNNT